MTSRQCTSIRHYLIQHVTSQMPDPSANRMQAPFFYHVNANYTLVGIRHCKDETSRGSISTGRRERLITKACFKASPEKISSGMTLAVDVTQFHRSQHCESRYCKFVSMRCSENDIIENYIIIPNVVYFCPANSV